MNRERQSTSHRAGREPGTTTWRRGLVLVTMANVLTLLAALTSTDAAAADDIKFKRIPTQFIAALAEPTATSGTNAQQWGLWREDPGPRGVRLGSYERLVAAGGIAPAKWKFDNADWWLEEHGLIMEPPTFPMPAGKYLVTGDREVTSVLTIYPKEANGAQRWELGRGATLYDVTHLGCRSARYTPTTKGATCSPAKVPQGIFPVSPRDAMPSVASCNKQDYAVLFVVGVAE